MSAVTTMTDCLFSAGSLSAIKVAMLRENERLNRNLWSIEHEHRTVSAQTEFKLKKLYARYRAMEERRAELAEHRTAARRKSATARGGGGAGDADDDARRTFEAAAANQRELDEELIPVLKKYIALSIEHADTLGEVDEDEVFAPAAATLDVVAETGGEEPSGGSTPGGKTTIQDGSPRMRMLSTSPRRDERHHHHQQQQQPQQQHTRQSSDKSRMTPNKSGKSPTRESTSPVRRPLVAVSGPSAPSSKGVGGERLHVRASPGDRRRSESVTNGDGSVADGSPTVQDVGGRGSGDGGVGGAGGVRQPKLSTTVPPSVPRPPTPTVDPGELRAILVRLYDGDDQANVDDIVRRLQSILSRSQRRAAARRNASARGSEVGGGGGGVGSGLDGGVDSAGGGDANPALIANTAEGLHVLKRCLSSEFTTPVTAELQQGIYGRRRRGVTEEGEVGSKERGRVTVHAACSKYLISTQLVSFSNSTAGPCESSQLCGDIRCLRIFFIANA